MTTTSPNLKPSARPPGSRRLPDLDSPQAQAFVEGAGARRDAHDTSGDDLRSNHPAAEVLPLPAATPIVEAVSQASAMSPRHGAEKKRREQMKVTTLRMSESFHDKLKWIEQHSPRSMNQFILDALAPAIEAEVEKIQKRISLGLD